MLPDRVSNPGPRLTSQVPYRLWRGLQGKVELSCGNVNINRIIIHDDNPNQGFYLVVGWGAQSEKAAGPGYSNARREVGREFSSIILTSNMLDHPYCYKSGSPSRFWQN